MNQHRTEELSLDAWTRAEETARAFSLDVEEGILLSEGARFDNRLRAAERVRRAVQARPENRARRREESEKRLLGRILRALGRMVR